METPRKILPENETENHMANSKKGKRTTEIEWTEHTWNPFAGCNVHSAGCTNCYAMRQAWRLEHAFKMPQYMGTTKKVNGNPVWTGVVNRSATTMKLPFKIAQPGLIFVNSMSDFFHPNAEDAWRLEALGVMQDCPRHRFQILTKRPELIAPFANRCALDRGPGNWFPDNVWIGATVEDAAATHRIDTLRQVRASVLFLSCEPLIGHLGDLDLAHIDWVIAGGESGPRARPMNVDWLRDLCVQCADQRVPFFFKQFGTPGNNPLFRRPPPGVAPADWVKMNDPVGKGGSLLDGVPWKQWPKKMPSDLEFMGM
jgi:protein gp37